MTADQLGKGHRNLTKDVENLDTREECVLAFFDWDKDTIYEHAAVRLLDWTWIWASSTAGMVVRIDPTSETVFRRQWREIEGALGGKNSTLRTIDWTVARTADETLIGNPVERDHSFVVLSVQKRLAISGHGCDLRTCPTWSDEDRDQETHFESPDQPAH
jgi:hypothetical protein